MTQFTHHRLESPASTTIQPDLTRKSLSTCATCHTESIIAPPLGVSVRAAFPRYRYDQLMGLGRKVFLPLSLARVVTFQWLHTFLVDQDVEHNFFVGNTDTLY